MKTNFFSAILLFSLLFACSADDEQNTPLPPPAGELIYVANEGAFNQGNASLTVYNAETGEVFQNVFQNANNNEPLGDILQSITMMNDELCLVVNNSQKIEIIDKTTFVRNRTITGLTSPRYMLVSENDKAYVSDLFAGMVHIVDPVSGGHTGSVSSGEWVERMLFHNGEIWCTTPGGDGLLFINPDTDEVTGSLSLSAGASNIAIDANGDVWVYCQGNFAEVSPAIHRIAGDTKAVATSYFTTATGVYGGNLEIDHTGEFIYYLFAGDLYKLHISSPTLPTEPLVSGGNRLLYGLNINHNSGQIAITDAVDYSSAGRVYLYNPNGTEITNFAAGIVPGMVVWGE